MAAQAGRGSKHAWHAHAHAAGMLAARTTQHTQPAPAHPPPRDATQPGYAGQHLTDRARMRACCAQRAYDHTHTLARAQRQPRPRAKSQILPP
eukprot:scaffold20030_cov106-Isochrysis_galbana.AAC.2